MLEAAASYLASDWQVTTCITLIGLVALNLSTWILRLKFEQKKHKKQLASLEKEVAVLSSSTVGMGQRLVVMQSKLDRITRLEEERTDTESQLAYASALRLLDTGADASMIAANSGLSKSEIKLMQLVHGQRDSA